VIRISVDVMGGDFGPKVVIPGAAKALERHPDIRFVLFGISAEREPILAQYPKLKAASDFHHCDVAVTWMRSRARRCAAAAT
jgi:glycerol-3-phosphate acyltransferase PlsX